MLDHKCAAEHRCIRTNASCGDKKHKYKPCNQLVKQVVNEQINYFWTTRNNETYAATSINVERHGALIFWWGRRRTSKAKRHRKRRRGKRTVELRNKRTQRNKSTSWKDPPRERVVRKEWRNERQAEPVTGWRNPRDDEMNVLFYTIDRRPTVARNKRC